MASPEQDRRNNRSAVDAATHLSGKNVKQKGKRAKSALAKKHEKKKRKLNELINGRSEGTHDEILWAEVRQLRQRLNMQAPIYSDSRNDLLNSQRETVSNLEKFTELDGIEIQELSSTGDGLGTHVDHPSTVFTVPFTAPGDVVRAKLIRDDASSTTTMTDFVSVLFPSQDRDDKLINCKYFATCSGCQFQMFPYTYQLAHKRRVVERAYKNFSGLPSYAVPEVGETISSPLQYGYRTKLTPHFDGPRSKKGRLNEAPVAEPEVPPIGFMRKGTRRVLDIEDCPIGTPAVQLGLKRERARVAREIATYRRGATVLLRESTQRVPKQENEWSTEHSSTNGSGIENDAVYAHHNTFTDRKTCISNQTATTTEYVGDFMFTNSANAFFQNNNSILPRFTQYVRDHILPKPAQDYEGPKITNLIDAYCGSGLFTVTLNNLFERSIGIDISVESIGFARMNARSNGLHLTGRDFSPGSEATRNENDDEKLLGRRSSPVHRHAGINIANEVQDEGRQVSFIAATASKLFDSVVSLDPLATAVVIDPPRKGCDEDFLRQLLNFGPQRIVYVSCNVHTQARDVGWILRNGEEAPPGGPAESDALSASSVYEMESLTGLDFFPQTLHVESIAVLRRKTRSVAS